MSTSPAPLYTRTFWLACTVHLTGAMALAAFLLFPLYVEALGGDDATIGMVAAVTTGAAVLVRFRIGALMDRLGRRSFLLASGLLHVATCLLYLTAGRLDTWFLVVTVLHGVAAGSLFAGYFTYAAEIVPPARRIEGLAIFGLSGLVANGIAPAVGEILLRTAGFPSFFLAAAACALASLLLTTWLSESAPAGGRAAGERAPARLRLLLGSGLPSILFTTFAFGVGVAACFTFVAPFAHTRGGGRAGAFFLAYGLAGAAIRVLGRRLPDLVAPRRVLLPALGLLALGLQALVFCGEGSGLLALTGAMCGAAHGAIFPVLNSVAVARSPVGQGATVVSVYTAVFDLGAVLGAPILGVVADMGGYGPMFWLASGAVLAGLATVAGDAGYAEPLLHREVKLATQVEGQ